MSKETLIDYLNKEIERTSSFGQQTGITLWAILGAIAFTTSKLIELFAHNSTMQFWSVTFLNFLFLSSAIYLLSAAYRSGLNVKSYLDLRLTSLEPKVPSNIMFGMAIYTLILWAITSVASQVQDISTHLRILMYFPAGLFSFFITIFLIYLGLKKFIPESNAKFSLSRTSVLSEEKEENIKANAFCFFLALFFMHGFLKSVEYIPQAILNDVLIATLYLFATDFLFGRLIGLRSPERAKYLLLLREFERDLIFDDVNPQEIIDKLKPLHGHKLNEWLSDKQKVLEERTQFLVNELQTTEALLDELRAINPGHKYEIRGRIKDFIASLRSAVEEYEKANTQIMVILRLARSKKLDKGEKDKINEVISRIEGHQKTVTSLNSIKMDVIEQFIDSIDLNKE